MKKMRLLIVPFWFAAVAFAQGSFPSITSTIPSQIDAGGPAFTLIVNVTSAVNGTAVVKWAGTPLTTSYINDNTLSATVPAGLIAICGKYLVTVTNAQNSPVSNSYPVVVNPVLKSLTPNQLPAGTGGTTVTASGLGFSSNVYLTLLANGAQTTLTTTYVNPTTLTAFVPATALNGIYPVSLFVADTTTAAVSQTLPITLTYASVTAISPTNILAGIDTFTLNVGGANFVSGAAVLWNGGPLATRFIDSTLLTATVPAALAHDAGDIGIQVKNPGAAASNSLKLVIGPNPYGTTITTIDPSSWAAGGPAVNLTVNGERFTQQSIVQWVRTPLTTVFVSSTQLTATIPASLVATEGVAPITVSTPGVTNSNPVSFTVNNVSPVISSISPTSAAAGGPAFTLTVKGDGFILASKVTGFPGSTTTYVSVNQLNVSVPASAIASVGTIIVQVANGSVVSAQAPMFTVKAATPPAAISSLSPTAATVGGGDFTLTVNGSNLPSGATVAWNASPLVTTFVSATQVTARVPAALLAAAGTASVTVTADGATSNALTFTISGPAGPTTSSGAILNAASSKPGVAPGELIAIYGSNLAGDTAQAAATPLPQALVSTSVTINGTAVPLLFVSPGQINAQVPYETKVGTAKLVIKFGALSSPSVDFDVTPANPGVFTATQTNHVLALNLSDGSLNSAKSPARPGEYVTAYLTGQGVVDPPVTTGDIAPTSPFSLPIAPVVIKVGGVPAIVQFDGLAPGFVGLLQLNVLIPDVPPGELSFEANVGGVSDSSTVISIAAKQ
jgi:uncharacterized protein (TIGR03437 family)